MSTDQIQVKWTDKDEEQLLLLQARKKQAEEQKFNRVQEIVEQFHFRNISQREVAEELIKRADEVIAALKPYKE